MNFRSTKWVLISSAVILSLPLMVKADINLENNAAYPGVQSPGSNTIWSEALERGIDRAIDPDDYVCSAPTASDVWVNSQFSQIDPLTLLVLDALGVFYWTFDVKTLFDQNDKDEYIGVNGEYTKRQNKTFENNKRFWDIYSDDILLMGAHGAAISDDELMQEYLSSIVFGYPPLFIQDILLKAARSAIEGGLVDLTYYDPTVYFVSPGIPGGYDNPLLTFNAYASSFDGGEAYPGSGNIPDRIVMGDGILALMTGIGIGYKEAPDFVLSHEFAHHVQFEIDAFEPGPTAPEKTRRTELMADGFAAYFNSHARGDSFQAKRFADVMTAAYEFGDCGFSSNGHHGTHLQRLNAATWGDTVSDSAPNQGHIYSPEYMLELFDAALPDLVAPDAP